MKQLTKITHSPDETVVLGKNIARKLKKGDIVCLFGELGTGKTTFVKGLAAGLGVDPDEVTSPTFVIMNQYEGTKVLNHFDLYRLEGDISFDTLGFDEFFYGEGISVVEWAERLGEFIPAEYLEIGITHKNESTRTIRIVGRGKRYSARVDALKEIIK